MEPAAIDSHSGLIDLGMGIGTRLLSGCAVFHAMLGLGGSPGALCNLKAFSPRLPPDCVRGRRS